MTFIVQLFGFMKRNIKLRYRNKLLFGFEIYQFVAILAVLIIYTFLFPAKEFGPEEYTPEAIPYNYLDKFLYIYPNSSEMQKLGSLVESEARNLKIRYFNDTEKMKDFFESQVDKKYSFTSLFGIEFEQFPSKYKFYHEYVDNMYDGNKVRYFSNGNECRKSEILTFFEKCTGNIFVYDGTTFVQYHLNNALAKFFNKTFPKFKVQLMAKGKYSQETNILTGISSFYFTVLYTYSLTSFVINIVAEKEKKIKELMKMMGMLNLVFWISWILTFLIQFTITNLVIAILLFSIGYFKSFTITIIFFFLIELFSIVAIIFGSLVSVFFQKSKTAGSASSAIYSIMSLLYFLVFLPRVFNTELPLWIQWTFSIIFQFSFSLGIDQLLFIQANHGSSFPSEFFANPARPNSLSILSCLLMLMVDGALYFILTIYFDNVIQGEYGRAKSPIFFLKPSFWFNRKKNQNTTNILEIDDVQFDSESVDGDLKNKKALKIKNLSKKFKNEKGIEYNAIDNLDLTVYSDQITAILGHNGAGKTTLFNILTGLLKPDAGTASFFDYDILSDRDLYFVRKMSGVCLQQDVLYDLLDCYEHLELYAYLKSVPRNQIKDIIEETLNKVGLIDLKKSRASQLSGGQKRKLSIAIALIGDPKILILDEPTSGMDPSSRREIWSLLQSLRQNRVILLSTHFMDEADILADRKAVITKGKLKCAGSSLYLKNKFGLGYHLNLIANQNFDQEPMAISSMIKKHVQNADLERFNQKEVSYILPIDSVANFQSLFEDIELNGQSVGIESVAISMTTLEEVFLKLADEVHDEKEEDNSGLSELQLSKLKLRPAFLKFIPAHFYAIIKLRFLMAYRYKITFLYRFIFPIPSIIFSILLPKIIKSLSFVNTNNLPTIDLAINDYATEKNPFLIVNKTNVDHLVQNLVVNNQLNRQPIKFTESESNIHATTYAGFIHQESLNDVILFYNDSSVFSVPYLVNTFTNLNSRLNGLPLLNATFTSWPQVKKEDVSFFDANSFTTLIILGISLIFPLVSFAAEVVQDRELKCKSQMRLSGCGFWNYWIPTLIAFLIQSSFLPIILFLIIYAIPPLNIAEFMPGGAIFSILLTTIIYIPLNLLVVMCLSFMFKKKETTLSFLFTFLLLLFIIPYLIVTLSQLSSLRTSNILHIVFTLLDPVYAFIGNYNRIAQVYLYQKVEDIKLGKNSTTVPFGSYFEFHLNFIPLTFIFGLINILLYGFLLYFIESFQNGINILDKVTGYKRMIPPNSDVIQNEDSDVKIEREKLKNNNLENCPLSVNELRKDFKKFNLSKQILNLNNLFSRNCRNKNLNTTEKKIAVRNLSIGFKQGEIFGLLGTNGAGKTTTINMICAELKPDAGTIKIKNEPFNLKNIQLFCQNVSVCPQHNPFWDELTLLDHLKIYGSLKKLSDEEIISLSLKFMEMLGISEHSDKQVKNLSGGTKRKLAYAITLFGNPEITLLDEPSTGLDPQSKRKFWNIISETLIMANKSAILTTHSMEEAEALCHRIGIMVNGELKCLGSSQYLKEKFGAGYLLELKINKNKTDDFNLFINDLFNDQAIELDNFSDHRLYSVPIKEIKSLARVFKALENAKSEDLIRQYDLSQTTLEQIFIQFAKS